MRNCFDWMLGVGAALVVIMLFLDFLTLLPLPTIAGGLDDRAASFLFTSSVDFDGSFAISSWVVP